MDHLIVEEVSYIRSRDPSIQNFNRNNLKKVRVNMEFSVNEKKDPEETVVEEDNNCSEQIMIQIYLRIKPSKNSDDYSIHDNDFFYKPAEQSGKNIKSKDSPYRRIAFSKIFRESSTQVQVFDEMVKMRVLNFINGNNTSLFVYGAAGAGKTYTTIGTADEPGFIPRTFEYLFKTLPKLPFMASVKPTPDGRIVKLNPEQKRLEMTLKTKILESQRSHKSRIIKLYQSMQDKLRNEPFASLEKLEEVSLGVWVCFVEIFNEEIYDLLQCNGPGFTDRKKLRIACSNGEAYIKDLTHIYVSNGLEAFQIYQYGIQKLKSSKTNMHGNTGMSHFIFTIKISQTVENRETAFISALNICNLAGMDSVRKTNCKDQLREFNSINNSLMVLGRCMNTLQDSQKYSNIKHVIPYRDSKLTLFFQKALSGMEDFCMMINLNSSKEALEENQIILNFSALTKEITTKEKVLKCISSNQTLHSEHLIELDHEMQQLEEALHEIRVRYEDLKQNRSQNYEVEKQQIITDYEDIFKDSEEISNMKKNHLKEELEKNCQIDIRLFRARMLKRMEKKKKKKLDEELKRLKETFMNNEQVLEKLEKEIVQLNNQLDELESRNESIPELQDSGESGMGSFLVNEKECEATKSLVGASPLSIKEATFELDSTSELKEIDSFMANKIEDEQINSMLVNNSSIICGESKTELDSTTNQSSSSLNRSESEQSSSSLKINESHQSLDLSNDSRKSEQGSSFLKKNSFDQSTSSSRNELEHSLSLIHECEQNCEVVNNSNEESEKNFNNSLEV